MQDFSYVVISLTSSIERRSAMRDQFRAHGIKARIFDAIEITAAVETFPGYDAMARQRRYGHALEKGELGCYLSHRAVWGELIASGDAAYCVMEADITLLEGFRAAVEQLYEARNHWDVVRLMGLYQRVEKPYAVLPAGIKIMWMDRQPVGTQCYLVTREAAIALLAFTERIFHTIDDALDRHWEHRLRLYIVSPQMARDAHFPSTIHASCLQSCPSLIRRLRTKFYRRRDKLFAALYNRLHRPKNVLILDQTNLGARQSQASDLNRLNAAKFISTTTLKKLIEK